MSSTLFLSFIPLPLSILSFLSKYPLQSLVKFLLIFCPPFCLILQHLFQYIPFHTESATGFLSVPPTLNPRPFCTGDFFLTHLLQLAVLVLITHLSSIPVSSFTDLCISPDHQYRLLHPFSPFIVSFLLAKLNCFYSLPLSFFQISTFVLCTFTSAKLLVISKPI